MLVPEPAEDGIAVIPVHRPVHASCDVSPPAELIPHLLRVLHGHPEEEGLAALPELLIGRQNAGDVVVVRPFLHVLLVEFAHPHLGNPRHLRGDGIVVRRGQEPLLHELLHAHAVDYLLEDLPEPPAVSPLGRCSQADDECLRPVGHDCRPRVRNCVVRLVDYDYVGGADLAHPPCERGDGAYLHPSPVLRRPASSDVPHLYSRLFQGAGGLRD